MLMTTGRGLESVGRTLSWSALGSFLRYMDPASATVREIDPEVSAWATTYKTNLMLADVIDYLASLQAILIKAHGGRPKKPTPYPRPGDTKRKSKTFGGKASAMPPDEMRKWIEKRRERHG